MTGTIGRGFAAPEPLAMAGAPRGLAAARLVVTVALACAAGALWAGCGRGTGSPPRATGSGTAAAGAPSAAPPPEACALLAPADVQAVTREVSGSLSSTLEDAVGRDPSQCSYGLGSDVPPRVISLAVRRLASVGQAEEQQEAAEAGLRSLGAGAPVADLPGLGDEAFWIGGRLDQLHVRRGDTLLVFTVQLDQDPLRAARSLAEKALARLATSPPPPPAGGGRRGTGP